MTLQAMVNSCEVDAAKAKATSPQDEQEIKALIENESSFEAVNDLVHKALWASMWSAAKLAVQQQGSTRAGSSISNRSHVNMNLERDERTPSLHDFAVEQVGCDIDEHSTEHAAASLHDIAIESAVFDIDDLGRERFPYSV